MTGAEPGCRVQLPFIQPAWPWDQLSTHTTLSSTIQVCLDACVHVCVLRALIGSFVDPKPFVSDPAFQTVSDLDLVADTDMTPQVRTFFQTGIC